MINVTIESPFTDQVQETLIVSAAEAVLKVENIVESVEISIVISDDENIRDLNNRYLGIDAPTDVLSFPADEFDPDTQLRYLGDMMISFPRALEQATATQETIADEIQLLTIHGALHLLGHDHYTQTEKKLMWEKQRAALELLGSKLTHLPE